MNKFAWVLYVLGVCVVHATLEHDRLHLAQKRFDPEEGPTFDMIAEALTDATNKLTARINKEIAKINKETEGKSAAEARVRFYQAAKEALDRAYFLDLSVDERLMHRNTSTVVA